MLKLRVSDIKQYFYCPRIIFFKYVCPVPVKITRKMEYGKEAHIELDRLEKRRTFKRYNLAEGRRFFHTQLYSPRLGLEGRLDMYIEAAGENFPVEFKNTTGGLSLNHKYQLVAYAMLLEDFFNRPVRFVGEPQKFHRLTTTGYALVMEALHEYPVNLGCLVYVEFKGDRMVVKKDIHIIDDELRQWFIEERDAKMRMIYEEIDPGLGNCSQNCPYTLNCRG
jgi:CRISPR-associated protein Cas4